MAAERAGRIGRRIRELREEKGWTQAQLAAALNEPSVTSTYVSRWERGEHEPLGDRLDMIASTLGTSSEDLMAGPVMERRTKDNGTPDLMGAVEKEQLGISLLAEKLEQVLDNLDAMQTRLDSAVADNVEMQQRLAEALDRLEQRASGDS